LLRIHTCTLSKILSQCVADLNDDDIVEVMSQLPPLQRCRQRFSSITLGTVQLGLNYGVANQSGKPSDAEAAAILAVAARAGITHLDTARAYGDSEARIGRLLPIDSKPIVKIISKLQLHETLQDNAPEHEVGSAVDASVYGSCRDLQREHLDVLMFHSISDMFRWHGAAIDHLQNLVDRGVIHALGASVYAPSDAVRALMDSRITHLQIPFNLLDSRWLNDGFLYALAQRPEVCVHARSVFLQGLLINQANTWPNWVTQSRLLVKSIEDLTHELGRKSAADLCIAYVRSFPWVTTLVLGVETPLQLEELLGCAAEPALTEGQAALVQARLTEVPARLLNPSLW
jgi:aryl-alcohol dehydrogenase-like predicted oxidoreductase